MYSVTVSVNSIESLCFSVRLILHCLRHCLYLSLSFSSSSFLRCQVSNRWHSLIDVNIPIHSWSVSFKYQEWQASLQQMTCQCHGSCPGYTGRLPPPPPHHQSNSPLGGGLPPSKNHPGTGATRKNLDKTPDSFHFQVVSRLHLYDSVIHWVTAGVCPERQSTGWC